MNYRYFFLSLSTIALLLPTLPLDIPLLASSIAQIQTVADQQAAAERFDQQGTEQYQKGEFQLALEAFQQELVIRQVINDREGEGTTLNNLGVVYAALGQYQEAIDYYTQALTISREVNNREGEGTALNNLGVVCNALGQYRKAINYYIQALAIIREVSDQATEGQILNNLGAVYAALGQYQEAIDYYTQSLAIRRDVNDRAGEGTTLNNLGAINDDLGQYQEAIYYYTQSLTIQREVGDRAGEGTTLNNLGSIYIKIGQYLQASDYLTQALTIAREVGNKVSEGGTLNNLGGIYNNLGQYLEAIDYFTQALSLTQEIGDRSGEGATLNNLGSVYDNLGQHPEAINCYTQALTIYGEVGNRVGEGTTLNNLGSAYHDLGQYRQAIEYFTQALTIYGEVGNRAGEGTTLNNLGSVYHDLGQYRQALEYFTQALGIHREVGNRVGEGTTLNNFGSVYHDLGQYQEALNSYAQALTIYRNMGNRADEGATLNNFGVVYHNIRQYSQAIDSYTLALAITKEVGDRVGEGRTLNNLGTIYLELRQSLQAIDYLTQSLAITREVGDRAGEGETRHNLGLVHFTLKQFPEAAEQLWAAVEVWESLRPGLTDLQKISLLDTQIATYQFLQQTLIALNEPERSLEVAERGRARAFIETLASRLGSDTAEDLVTANLPNLQQIRQIAQTQGATLVEYSIIPDDRLYIWVVQPTGEIAFRAVDLSSLEAPLSELVSLTRTSLGVRGIVDWLGNTPETVPSSPSQTSAQLQQLHKLLIEPIASLLPSDPDAPVILIPQGELFLVPFPALQSADGTYLIDQHTILTAPSIQVLDKTRQQAASVQQAHLQNVLVVGNPTMPSVSLPYLLLAAGDPPQQLDPLPGAQQEAEDVADRFHTQLLTGSQASKAAVVAQMPQARIIHLATHGLLDDQQGLDSAIALAPDGTGQANDGLLTAAELAEMKLNAELVVLSACNTGRGRISGDGVLGLSRSLILAGVPSVMVSLWSVPDAPTAALMDEFYKQLQQGHSKAHALRQAMLSIKAIDPDPVNWAAFTLIGEAN